MNPNALSCEPSAQPAQQVDDENDQEDRAEPHAICYLAVEPYARRYWPESLISWNRVQSGRLNDPLVASHVLVGMTGFMVYEVLAAILWRYQPIAAFPEEIDPLQATGRRLWLADLLVCLLVSLASPLDISSVQTFVVSAAVILPVNYFIVSWQIRRFGLVAIFFGFTLSQSRMPLMPGSWHTGRDLFTLLIPLAFAGWALWVIVSSRRIPGPSVV